jgi:hypothetical protein
MIDSPKNIDEVMFPKNFDRHELGSCMLAAEYATRYLLAKHRDDFKVIEGWVSLYSDQEEEDWSAHTWIRFTNGRIFDPTKKQWKEWGFDPKNVTFEKIKKEYTPQQYLQLCKKYSEKQ